MTFRWDNTHGNVSSLLISKPPIVHVLAASGSSRCSWAFLHYWNNFSTSLGNFADEWAVQVLVIIDNTSQILSFDCGMESVWVLSSTVVSPNDNILNIFDSCTSSFGELTKSASLIESSHGSKVLLWDWRSICGCNESIGISWVANDTYFDCFFSNLIHDWSLLFENFCICLK